MKRFIALIGLFAFVLLASCSKNSTNPTDNNNPNLGNNAASVTSNKGTFNFRSGLGVYDKPYDYTDLAFTGFVATGNQQSLGYMLTLSFAGNKTGVFQLNDDNGIIMMIDFIVYVSVEGTGKITITRYGAVGSTIEGSFSGQLQSSTGDVLTVTGATFKATRLQDEEDDGGSGDNYNAFISVNMNTVEFGPVQISTNKAEGNGTYTQSEGMLAVGAYYTENPDDEHYTLAITLFAMNVPAQNNYEMDIEGTQDRSLIVTVMGMPYRFVGRVKINQFAQSTGQNFEISGSGQLFSLVDGNKVADVEQFLFRAPRAF